MKKTNNAPYSAPNAKVVFAASESALCAISGGNESYDVSDDTDNWEED